MPYVYTIAPAALQTSNATPNTENDCLFIKPGSARTIALFRLLVHGKGAALTAISGITFRVRRWFTTASSSGTSITPTPSDYTVQAAKCTAAYATATVTSGTGADTTALVVGCGAAGPGGWVAENPDAMIQLEAAVNRSIDVFNASGTASLNFEQSLGVQE